MTGNKSSISVLLNKIRCLAWAQADGRCKFFKWQDELLNSNVPPPQQPDSGSQAGNQPASNMQAAPSAVPGGSGVFADGGMPPACPPLYWLESKGNLVAHELL